MSCRVIVTFILAVVTVVTAVEIRSKVDNKPPSYQYMKTKIGDNEVQTFQAGNGVVGVSSIAGIASRNGRVSSVSGVNFYPGIQAPIMATGLSTTNLGKTTDTKYKYPVSTKIIKSEDGKYVSSSINISPGSVSVSSIARSAPPVAGKSNSLKTFPSDLNNPLYSPIKPFGTSPFLQNSFNIRNLNPWFPNYMLQTPYPVRTSYQSRYINPMWQYPSFPFMNYWQ